MIYQGLHLPYIQPILSLKTENIVELLSQNDIGLPHAFYSPFRQEKYENRLNANPNN